MAPLDRLLFTRAIMPSLVPMITQPADDATFVWIQRPSRTDMPDGVTYMDGSLLYGNHSLQGLASRTGWAAATYHHVTGELLAAAHGKPPAWLEGIHGAELWSLLQSFELAGLQNQLRTDCMAVKTGALQSQSWANSPARLYGRAWGPVATAFEGTAGNRLAWMPAHCSKSQAGQKEMSNGCKVSDIDIAGNAFVDKWAKEAAEAQAPPKQDFELILQRTQLLQSVARWIGVCTEAANHYPGSKDEKGRTVYLRDSEAKPKALRKAKPVKRKRSPSPQRRPGDLSKCPRWAALRERVLSRSIGAS